MIAKILSDYAAYMNFGKASTIIVWYITILCRHLADNTVIILAFGDRYKSLPPKI